MGLVAGYAVLAVLFLVLALGAYTPKRWRELEQKQVKLLKFGCFFVFGLLLFNIVNAVAALL